MSSDPTALRVALAWRELRRGASGAVLRRHLVGPDGPLLEQAQLDALEILAGEPAGWRMSEFADAMRVDPSTATRAILRLEQVGLAERVRGDTDGRVVIARTTATGKKTAKRVAHLRSIGLDRLLQPFDDAEREVFAEHLERFVESINRLVDELEHDR